ncbi:PQQ-dependent sugar dehydrogenase [Hymenobacter sp. 15J16-1T3B]|uniref:PQQ-dependent sugar dehydrogenase n=1 Tax=Hymenobacter sp. 15J16-1T3B TaxID=2886941 RepID=UPI001D0F6667|nr:PQQ-dependent sugar dehydrogenase [Hymenobacter sp. 15J16-1T3B]MCC3157836.1 PQQ-dependent sugar dehydrogenase [Hymenobacter sp. 15J16-1T3B]
MKRFAASILLLTLACAGRPDAVAQPTTYQLGSTTLTLSTLTTGLNTPWELLWGPDNFLWMTERGGRISRINPATGQVLPLLTLSDVTQTGESGLLGMAILPSLTLPAIPQYSVFVVYTYTDNGAVKEKLVRYYYDELLGMINPQVILDNLPATNIHSGSRLLILPDRTLLMTTGDASNTSLAQNPQALNGKILRLNPDGTVPTNNPTPGSLVYTLGHRNPQGLVRVAATGRLYSSEHGPNNDDELNLIEAGRNYGWPNVEGFCNLAAEQPFCLANNVREPLTAWTPTRAVAGLTYYNHPAIPQWANTLLLVSLKDGALTSLPLNASGDQLGGPAADLWAGTYGRLRAICVSPQGRVYLTTSNRDGRGAPAATDDRVFVLENRAYSPTATQTAQSATWQLYPNPAPAALPAELNLPALPEPAALELTDSQGRRVWLGTAAAQQTRLQLPAMAPGAYVLRMRTAEGREQYARLLRY